MIRAGWGIDSWGVLFGSALFTLVYGSAPILLSLGAAIVSVLLARVLMAPVVLCVRQLKKV